MTNKHTTAMQNRLKWYHAPLNMFDGHRLAHYLHWRTLAVFEAHDMLNDKNDEIKRLEGVIE